MSDVLPGEFVFHEAQLLKAAFSTLAIVIRIFDVVVAAAVFGSLLCRGSSEEQLPSSAAPAGNASTTSDLLAVHPWMRRLSRKSAAPALIRLAHTFGRFKSPAHAEFGEGAGITKLPIHNETISGHSA